MTNRLAEASSPYLLQHKDNPVAWYEWSKEAFAAAKLTDKPILLSVGYSACHWCHVMAHESFEDPDTASYMNEHFVNVKVDREERPDVDRVYMDAVQAMTGHGGWPMTVFLTPDGEPFFAGTYFPKEGRSNYPSFMQVLTQVNSAWNDQRAELVNQAGRLVQAVRATAPTTPSTPSGEVVRAAVSALESSYDWEHGGFGGAPKFPQAPNLEVLLRVLALDLVQERRHSVEGMLRTALDRMAAGGIYDQLGGGFARYAVDRIWLVPHFEKMLYDNAMLARVYLRAWQLTGDDRYRKTSTETLDYLLRDMQDPLGGIYSAEDADSEGEEGRFYIWQWDEFEELLGADAPPIAALYGLTREGNFEGSNILYLAGDLPSVATRFGLSEDELSTLRADAAGSLLERRNGRIRPGLDDKVVTAWNGLALRAFAEAGAVLENEAYLAAAVRIAEFAATHLTEPTGRLVRSWRGGSTSVGGFCDDYAAMAVGLFTLYQATGHEPWYVEAERLTRSMIDLFADPEGGFFATARDADQLIARPKNLQDNPTPSDNSLAAEALLMLGSFSGDSSVRAHLDGTFRAAGALLERYPAAVGHLVSVLAVADGGPKEVAITGRPDQVAELREVVWETFRPDCFLASTTDQSVVPLLAGRDGSGHGARAYVCRDFVCDLPVATREDLRLQLAGSPG